MTEENIDARGKFIRLDEPVKTEARCLAQMGRICKSVGVIQLGTNHFQVNLPGENGTKATVVFALTEQPNSIMVTGYTVLDELGPEEVTGIIEEALCVLL